MSYHFEFDSTNGILRIWFEGHLTDEDLKEYYVVVRKYVANTNPSAAILDMSAVTTVQLSPQTIRELAASPPTIPEPIRPRFIVAPSPPIFGFARMFELGRGDASEPPRRSIREGRVGDPRNSRTKI